MIVGFKTGAFVGARGARPLSDLYLCLFPSEGEDVRVSP